MTRSSRNSAGTDSDAALFDAWVEAHGADLYRFAYRRCGDGSLAEDLVQQAFYDAWKHPHPLGQVRNPRAWLFLILRRRWAKTMRLERRRLALESFVAPRGGGVSNHMDVDQSDDTDAIQSALDRMDDLFKIPLLMVFVQGMSCAQVAKHLDVPLGTVLSRIHRGKRRIRETLKRQGEPQAPLPRDTSEADAHDEAPQLRIGGGR